MKNSMELPRTDDAAGKETASYRAEAGDKINPLTTEAYFRDQADIEKSLLRFERGLGEYKKYQQSLESLRKWLVEAMTEQAEGKKSQLAVPKTPEEILADIKEHEEQWTRNRGMEESGIIALEQKVNEFCNRYGLPVKFDSSASAQETWNRIQEAYEAKMWRTTNNLPETHTLGE